MQGSLFSLEEIGILRSQLHVRGRQFDKGLLVILLQIAWRLRSTEKCASCAHFSFKDCAETQTSFTLKRLELEKKKNINKCSKRMPVRYEAWIF